jgi:hypothetical protein
VDLSTTILIGIVVAVISGLVTDDLKEWMPWFVERLLRIAVCCLPQQHKSRMDEEWRSHINEMPGHLGKLCIAIGCCLAALKISRSEERFVWRIRYLDLRMTALIIRLILWLVDRPQSSAFSISATAPVFIALSKANRRAISLIRKLGLEHEIDREALNAYDEDSLN